MDSVLSKPELLDNIFSSLDKVSNSRNMLLCRAWYWSCCAIVWRNITTHHDLKMLCRVLAPVYRSYDRNNVYISHPRKSDWDRFEIYCGFIRYLVLNTKFFDGLLTRIAESRPTFNLFPKIDRLELRANDTDSLMLHCGLFMHPNIKDLSLTISDMYPALFDTVLRLQFLDRLEINYSREHLPHHSPLLDCLEQLQNVKTLVLSWKLLSSAVLEELSRLPNLTEIAICEGSSKTFDFPLPEGPDLKEGAFPSLLDLAVRGDIPWVTRLFNHRFFPSKITGINIELLIFEQPSSISRLLSLLVDRCQEIENIGIHDNTNTLREKSSDIPEEEELTLGSI